MNKGLYRLVFNQLRGIWMVADETATGHQSGKNATRRESRKRARSHIDLYVLLAGLTTALLSAPAAADGETINVNNLKVIQGNITQAVNGNTLNINQASQKGIMQGAKFNIAPHETVNFNHSGGQFSSTLVRITGERSVIQGVLNSPNGAVHLINQSGVLFADGAKVNVNGLVVSALNIKDQDYLDGHTTPYTRDGRAAYVWEGDKDGYETVLVQIDPGAKIRSKLGSQVMVFAPKVINKGSIEVSKAAGVDDSGAASQVVMAAGAKVYLSYAPDLNAGNNVQGTYTYKDGSPYRAMAGVLVEVDSFQQSNSRDDDIKGVVTNDVTGRVLAQQGNVTMAGYMVNQKGRVTATASVNQKGSIRLLARDTLHKNAGGQVFVENVDGGTNSGRPESVADRLQSNQQEPTADTIITASNTGELTIGDNSVTAVLPEDPATSQLMSHYETEIPVDTNLTDAQNAERSAYTNDYYAQVNTAINNADLPTITSETPFNPSTIEAVGHQISVNDGAKVIATAGHISISARQDGNTFTTPSEADENNLVVIAREDEESRVYIGNNTLIDASGLKNVDVDMERNFVERLLTFTDLKNNAVNREEGRFLYRSNVWFDIRNTPDDRVADLDGFVNQVPRSMGELSAAGGSVKIESQGDIIQRSSSAIDVSGGTLKFSAGLNKETWLVDASGNAYSLGNAPADTIFTGFYGGQNSINTSEAAYTEGKSAGTVSLEAYNLVVNGKLTGHATYGERQLESENLGGTLNIEAISAPQGTTFTFSDLKTFDLTDQPEPLDDAFNLATALPGTRREEVDLSASMLNESGFETMSLTTPGEIQVNAALNLEDGTKLNLNGFSLVVNQNITARSGSVNLTTDTITQLNGTNRENIIVADNVKIDVSGNWINELYLNSLTRRLTAGGTINIDSAESFTLSSGALLDVSGGAHATRDDIQDVFSFGSAGEITINTNRDQTGSVNNPYGNNAPVLLGELRGFSLARGGKVSVTAPHVTVGALGYGGSQELLLSPDFFTNQGFTDFTLTGRDGLVVREGTLLDVVAKNFVLNGDFAAYSTGSHVYDFASVKVQPQNLRYATSLTFQTQETVLNQESQPLAASGLKRGSVHVETGAKIQVDTNGFNVQKAGDTVVPTIALKAWDNQLYVNGELVAPGGEISLIMNGNAASGTDTGYNNAQVIWLGSQARLSAAGFVNRNIGNALYNEAAVMDGGTVNLEANKGYVITKAGSFIDVSGVSADLDVNDLTTIKTETVHGDAGLVNVEAREGMLLDNTFNASAQGGLHGRLTVDLGRDSATLTTNVVTEYPGTPGIRENFDPYLPNQIWYLDVYQENQGFANAALFGSSLESLATGQAKVGLNSIAGFGDVTLLSEDSIRFNGNIDHAVQSNLVLNANTIEASGGANVNLSAARFALGNYILGSESPRDNAKQFASQSAEAGTATLTLSAQKVDFYGNLAVSGFSQTTIRSEGGTQFTGFINKATVSAGDSDPTPTGVINFNGEVNLIAKQFSPTTLSSVTLNVAGSGNVISFSQPSSTQGYDAVVSALGGLTVNAETIQQNGVILAPFGNISLNAENLLTLSDGSVTSVSANGSLIPFGFTGQEGQLYFYDFGGNVDYSLTSLPEKNITLNAANLNFNQGAQVDISGGGDLFAYEWIPGVGGGRDVLSPEVNQNIFGDNVTNTWAIIDNDQFNKAYANYDIQYWAGSNVAPGEAIYLSNVDGLSDGYYTLLPARYALLDGAMLVSKVSGYDNLAMGSNLRLQNGASIVSGQFANYTQNGYVNSGQRSGLIVRSGSDAYKLAQYDTTTATDFFNQQSVSTLPADAGVVSFAATSSLILQGIIDALPGTGGKGAKINVGAPNLLIVGDEDTDGSVTLDGVSYLAIKESTLNTYSAASLLLGGTRDQSQLSVLSSEVRLNQNANLSGPEVILAAKDQVRLETGAKVTGTGEGGLNESYIIGGDSASGDGAYVAVSGTADQQTLTRQNVSGASGDIIVESGATIHGDQTVVVDHTGNATLDGTITFADQANVAIGSKRISIGTPANNDKVVEGIAISDAQLNQFTSAGSLTLSSQSSIDIYGAVAFGNEALDLTVNAAGVSAYQNSGLSSSITAKSVTLNNSESRSLTPVAALASGATPIAGNGNLQVTTQQLIGEDGVFAFNGYDQVTITAEQSVTFQGDLTSSNSTPANQLVANNNLTINTPYLTSANSAHYQVEASNGTLTVAGTGTGAQLSDVTSGGSDLTLKGDRVLITDQSLIDMRSAKTTVYADGIASADGVEINNGAKIVAKGTSYQVFDEQIDYAAGQVQITAENGDITLADGSQIDLTAVGEANAGQLSLSAENGTLTTAGSLTAESTNGSASAHLDAATYADLSNTINQLSDFSKAQSYRQRSGNLLLDASDTIKASDILLSADAGSVILNGQLDASGESGGNVSVYARDNVVLGDGGQILAQATSGTNSQSGSIGNGGEVLLSSAQGTVSTGSAATGSLIDVSGNTTGTTAGEGGKVIFRALRTNATAGVGDGVQVGSSAAAVVTGADKVLLEAVKTYDTAAIDAVQTQQFVDDTKQFINDVVGTIGSYASTIDGVSVTLAPSIDVVVDGDINFTDNWIIGYENYDQVFTGDVPRRDGLITNGFLSLRATGDVNVAGDINYEQLSSLQPDSTNYIIRNQYQVYDQAWHYRFVAGLDTSAANINAVQSKVGDFNVADDAIIRTGAGFIKASAGNDITLGADAAIYTEGKPLTLDELSANSFRAIINNFGGDNEFYTDGGGDVSIAAGNNISGEDGTNLLTALNSWFSHGGLNDDTAANKQLRWYASFKDFENGIGALGGGKVTVKADGDISNLQLVSASNARMAGSTTEAPDASNLISMGGGDVEVIAGQSITNAMLHTGDGDVSASANNLKDVSVSLIDGSASLTANQSVDVDQVTNPTTARAINNTQRFYSYADDSVVKATALAGDVIFGNPQAEGSEIDFVSTPNVMLSAAKGDVAANDFIMYPSATGNLTILAGNNVRSLGGQSTGVVMSDVNPASLVTLFTESPGSLNDIVLDEYQTTAGHQSATDANGDAVHLHSNDDTPVKVYALNDINFHNLRSKVDSLPVVFAKETVIQAGGAVNDPNLIIQNVKDTDITMIKAGTSIGYREADIQAGVTIAQSNGLQVAGPGRLHVVAGDDIDFGVSTGVRSIGNAYNTNLSETGADIYIQSGATGQRDHSAFIESYLGESSAYRSTYLPALQAYMAERGDAGITEQAALDGFKALTKDEQVEFINYMFYLELRDGAREAVTLPETDPNYQDYSRPNRAILTLFPAFTNNTDLVNQSGSIHDAFGEIANETPNHSGDLTLFSSQVKSERGGRIELMLPYGRVVGGLAVSSGLERPDSDQGVLSLRGGELYGLVRTDFLVNQSRVFTLGGSDLMLYSALADIDAGKGAKTASATPPPVLRIVDGQVVYDYSAAVAGSGIAALTSTGGEPGTVDLYAPYGEIDAGEAGIRVEGNAFLGAQTVVGADNISVGGASTGVAVSTAGVSIAAPVTPAANSENVTSDSLSEAGGANGDGKDKTPSLFTVEVLALEDAAPDEDEEDEEKKGTSL